MSVDALPAVDVVVAAAGSSRRMGGIDKLRAPLLGRPLLAHTLDALAAAPCVRRLVVCAPPESAAALAGEPWLRALEAVVVEGGGRRQESVAVGVRATDAPIVLVHDGARPLVPPQVVERVALAAWEHGAAVPLLPVAETIKEVSDGRVVRTVDRTSLATAQTPQGARRELLLDAYDAFDPAGARTFTDESSLLEAHGVPVVAVEGDPGNVKITVPHDLARAEAVLRSRVAGGRVGHGHDSHPFGAGDGLALGGIRIDAAPRLHGHSDGDAALHAIADALLGAAALGDLGRVFPAGDAATRGIDSGELLHHVLGEVRAAGWAPASVDLTIVAGRPRLGRSRLEAMRDAIAELLGLAATSVSVKASSGNLSGDEGAGRTISASALVQVEPA